MKTVILIILIVAILAACKKKSELSSKATNISIENIDRYRPFYNLITKTLSNDIQTLVWEKVKNDFTKVEKNSIEFTSILTEHLNDLDVEKNWVLLLVDWKDYESVEWQAEKILNTRKNSLGIKLSKPTEKSENKVWDVLLELSDKLKEHDLNFIAWDQDADQYTGFIVNTEETEKIIKEGKKIGLKLFELDKNKPF